MCGLSLDLCVCDVCCFDQCYRSFVGSAGLNVHPSRPPYDCLFIAVPFLVPVDRLSLFLGLLCMYVCLCVCVYALLVCVRHVCLFLFDAELVTLFRFQPY